MFCPYCRTRLAYGASVCPVCNARLNTPVIVNDSNGTAMAAFVMALLSIFLPILVLPAIICGHIGLAHSRTSLTRTGHGLSIAALVIGYLIVITWVLGALFLLGVLGLLFAAVGEASAGA